MLVGDRSRFTSVSRGAISSLSVVADRPAVASSTRVRNPLGGNACLHLAPRAEHAVVAVREALERVRPGALLHRHQPAE